MTQPSQPDVIFQSTASLPNSLAAPLTAAAVAPLHQTGWIRIIGTDRTRWLNGMVTNSIQQLKPGEGSYSFLLSAQGRIQGDAYIFAAPEAFLLESASQQIPNLIALLDKFIIMDDVELADISSSQSGLLLAGPNALSLLQQIGLTIPDQGALTRTATPWNAAEVAVIHAHSPLTPRFEIWTDPATAEHLQNALQQAGAASIDSQTLEQLRILEGTPLYGIDIRDRELPQETAQDRALHFNKGCYLGQEIVERIRSRGNVHRTFTGFRLEGALPKPGTKLIAEEKEVGELTSITAIPLSGGDAPAQLALGYIRREIAARNIPLTYPGGTAIPASLPFSHP